MINLIFESHKTTTDNEVKIASGWNDSKLSPTGVQQGIEDRERYVGKKVDAVFCSDLSRATLSAQLIFSDEIPIFTDWRLREYNFGDLNGAPKSETQGKLSDHITQPYPGGESVMDALARMRSFLESLQPWDEKTIVVIGHRATQLGLEHHINGVDPLVYVTTKWSWQPGWVYELDTAKL